MHAGERTAAGKDSARPDTREKERDVCRERHAQPGIQPARDDSPARSGLTWVA